MSDEILVDGREPVERVNRGNSSASENAVDSGHIRWNVDQMPHRCDLEFQSLRKLRREEVRRVLLHTSYYTACLSTSTSLTP